MRCNCLGEPGWKTAEAIGRAALLFESQGSCIEGPTAYLINTSTMTSKPKIPKEFYAACRSQAPNPGQKNLNSQACHSECQLSQEARLFGLCDDIFDLQNALYYVSLKADVGWCLKRLGFISRVFQDAKPGLTGAGMVAHLHGPPLLFFSTATLGSSVNV